MKAKEISAKIIETKNKIIKDSLTNINAELAEIHDKLNILEEESTVHYQEFKNARKYIGQTRDLIKIIEVCK